MGGKGGSEATAAGAGTAEAALAGQQWAAAGHGAQTQINAIAG